MDKEKSSKPSFKKVRKVIVVIVSFHFTAQF